jgi:hypothetical protein
MFSFLFLKNKSIYYNKSLRDYSIQSINNLIQKIIEKNKYKVKTIVDNELNSLRYNNIFCFLPSFFLFNSLFLHSNKK